MLKSSEGSSGGGGKLSSSSFGGDDRVNPPKHFPCCVVWCPLPLITAIFPPIGHMGICYSNGFIVDFLGPRFVHRGSLGFGNVARYWRLDPSLVTVWAMVARQSTVSTVSSVCQRNVKPPRRAKQFRGGGGKNKKCVHLERTSGRA